VDFRLKDEQLMIQRTARDFAKKELEPVAQTIDKTKDFSILVGNVKKMAQLGFMGLAVPECYGGVQAGAVAYSLALTEIGRACASTAVTMSVTNMVAELLVEFGTELQKRTYIPKLLSGEYAAGAFGLTESSAGSDPTSMKTTAVENKDGYLLNGSKLFITSAEYAGMFIVWAITDKQVERRKGMSAFIVERNTPGCTVGKNEEKMGQRGSATNEIIFEDCWIPKENLLGKLNNGYRIALAELAGGRIGIGSMALGIGLAAMDFATNYAKERIQFGKPISSFQALQWMIADSYTELEAAQLLILRAAFLKETGQQFAREAAMGKLYATEAANRACYKAVQMLGGYGYVEEYPVERYYRDVRVTTIYEGTSEIQRLLIARSFLK
jgi:alkylation response protein AidB-like acyl-CoA dehydrogenase